MAALAWQGDPELRDFAQQVGLYLVLFLTSYQLCFAQQTKLLSRLLPAPPDDATRASFAMKTCSMLHAVAVAPAALRALLGPAEPIMAGCTRAALSLSRAALVDACATDLIHGESPTARALTPVTVAFFVYELVHLRKWEPISVGMTVAHHVISIALWPYASVARCGHWYLLVWLAYEASTPFLQLRWMIDKLAGKGKLYLANGALMTLSFLGVRNLTAPAVALSITVAVRHNAGATVQLYGVAALIPIALNLVWGYQMLRGIYKLLLGGGGGSGAKKKKK